MAESGIYLELFEKLLALRDNPEEFQRVADECKERLITSLGKNRLREFQEQVDSIIASSPDSLAGATTIFGMMKEMASLCQEGLDNLNKIKGAMEESSRATKN